MEEGSLASKLAGQLSCGVRVKGRERRADGPTQPAKRATAAATTTRTTACSTPVNGPTVLDAAWKSATIKALPRAA
jgi:hypothetical protein